MGKLFTIFDIKFAYLTFFLIFQVGSVVCAVATSSLILILGRIIAGMGVAGMFAGGMLIVSSCIKPESRAREYSPGHNMPAWHALTSSKCAQG